MNGNLFGMGSWTKGALDFSAVEIAATKAAHPGDQLGSPRPYINVVLIEGEWTSANGTNQLSPASENPAITASALYNDHGIPTYVIALGGDPFTEAMADGLAAAGGTGQARLAPTPNALQQSLLSIVQDIESSIAAPACCFQ